MDVELEWEHRFGNINHIDPNAYQSPVINPATDDILSPGDFHQKHVEIYDFSQDGIALAAGRSGWNENARYVPEWDTWMFWDGERWVKKEWVHAQNKVREFLRNVAQFAKKETEINKIRSRDMATSVEILLRSNDASLSTASQWNENMHLLGTPKGTVDLKTGILRAARKEDYITKFSAVFPADIGAKHPVWTKFLNDVFEGDEEVIDFMQRAAGWALTGDTTEHKLIFNYGTGRNGKGVFMHTIASIMKDYAMSVDSSVFISSPYPQHATSIAQMQGARLVESSEIEKGKAWNGEVLKRLTGGDVISARFMRQDNFEFKPQLSLFISGNNKPSFKGIGTSIRERFLLVPFTQNFTGSRQDPDLEKKLKSEWPAILRWMINGAIDWQIQGLNPPKKVLDASADYLDDEDDISRFIETYLEDDPTSNITVKEVYTHFKTWQLDEGVKSLWSMNAMSRSISEDGNCSIKKNTRPTGGGNPTSCILGKKIKLLTNNETYDEARYL